MTNSSSYLDFLTYMQPQTSSCNSPDHKVSNPNIGYGKLEAGKIWQKQGLVKPKGPK